jgi:MFS transporter, ACS family, glucarate transporter
MKKIFFPTRYMLVFSTFLLSVLLYIDRVCISVAKEPIAEALQLSDTEIGWVLSIFALGYALAQTPAGILNDRFGPRIILTAVVSFWSLFTALTGAAWNYLSLLVVRFVFGVGEAGAFPGIARATFSWIPLKERGIVTGINFSGSRLGAAFALPAVAWLIETLGWRMSFLVLGVVGFIWALIWYWWFRNVPEQHKRISDGEKEFILATRQQVSGKEEEKLSAGLLLNSKNMWLAMGQYFASNFTFFFSLTWLFPHIKTQYGLEAVEAGFYASAPLVFGALGNYFSGYLVDKIYSAGKWRRSRRLPAIIGFVLASFGLIASLYMDSAIGAVVFLSLAIFGADMTLSPSWSLCVDIGKRNSGAVSGTMNMAGNIGSFVTALAFPYLLSWFGEVKPFFYLAAILNVLAIFLWLQAKPEKSLKEY